MIGKYTPPELITPEEALAIFKYGTLSEMYRAKALYDIYRRNFEPDTDKLWGFIRLLSFVYDTARIQGIREERAKRSQYRKE